MRDSTAKCCAVYVGALCCVCKQSVCCTNCMQTASKAQKGVHHHCVHEMRFELISFKGVDLGSRFLGSRSIHTGEVLSRPKHTRPEYRHRYGGEPVHRAHLQQASARAHSVLARHLQQSKTAFARIYRIAHTCERWHIVYIYINRLLSVVELSVFGTSTKPRHKFAMSQRHVSLHKQTSIFQRYSKKMVTFMQK